MEKLTPSSGDMNAFMDKLSPSNKKIVKNLRKIILKAVPNVDEEIKWGMPCYSQNVMICNIIPAKAHVSLAFFKGVGLTDPNRLLEGEGKKMRHIKLRSENEIKTKIIAAWVREAVSLNPR